MAGLVLAAASAAASGPEDSEDFLPAWLDRPLGTVLSPGALAEPHAHLEGASECLRCHDPLRGTTDAQCLACHEDVAERMQARRGVHGSFTGRCADCHVEHRGVEGDLLGLDREGFNHDRALFPLRGAHRDVECEKCHLRARPDRAGPAVERFHPIEIPHESCAACHESPHGERFGTERDCSACHTEAAWAEEGLRPEAPESAATGFAHDRDTGFALTGAHARVRCEECHTPARRALERDRRSPPGTAAPQACNACHEDPHRRALGASCERCHAAIAWSGPKAPFDHSRRTRFALDPLHERVACAECHSDARFRAAGTECASCHGDAADLLAGRFGAERRAPDPHREIACAECHDAGGDRLRWVDVERECVRCHTSQYGGLLLTRRRILDDLVVRAEGRIRSLELAAARGEGRTAPDTLVEARDRIERLSRSGLHHPDLAEAMLRDTLDSLPVPSGAGRRGTP